VYVFGTYNHASKKVTTGIKMPQTEA